MKYRIYPAQDHLVDTYDLFLLDYKALNGEFMRILCNGLRSPYFCQKPVFRRLADISDLIFGFPPQIYLSKRQ
ncbi:hypothetical protein QW71_29005 [Paenibacillus sp. IHB B 3415]|nr:hypothetical protein QW71_29005 [Paenibacillus sp. IHB B 3415]